MNTANDLTVNLETYIAPVKQVRAKSTTPRVKKYEPIFNIMGIVERNSFVERLKDGDTLEKLRGRIRSAAFNYTKNRGDVRLSVIDEHDKDVDGNVVMNAEGKPSVVGVRVIKKAAPVKAVEVEQSEVQTA